MRLSNKSFVVLICIFLFTAGISLFGLISEKRQFKEAEVLYEAVQRSTEEKSKEPSAKEEISLEEVAKEIDFNEMKEKFPHIVGWIYEEGTGIDYPVVQGPNNEYYLNRLANGKNNKLGAIFLDSTAQPDFSSPVSVIYGHEMKGGQMFGNLSYYRSQEFYDNYPTFTLFTETATFTIDLIGSYLEDGQTGSYPSTFENEKDFLSYLEKVRNKSFFQGKAKVEYKDKIIILSTCAYDFYDARLAVVGTIRQEEGNQ